MVDYDQVDISNIEVKKFPAFDADAYAVDITNVIDVDQYEFGVISNARTDLSFSVRSIDSLFSRVPSTYELEEIISGADSVALLQTIQNLVTNDAIPCPAAFSYLLEILGRIRYTIVNKQFAIDQL